MYRGEKPVIEPGLFDEIPVNPPITPIPPEYSKEIEVKQEEIPNKKSINQEFIHSFTPSKKIDKIMIFYSDSTFNSFTPD
jgi:hypothetical protein